MVAAACSLPYALARTSWLTPWPQFGGSAEAFENEPAMLLTGLLLGLGMLTGGFFTLGLIRPWGERLPRGFAVIGGRPMPVGLAVIPATIVAVLFFTSGAEFLFLAFEGEIGARMASVIELMLLFPFWLWGPLLALAAWGYAMHRASEPGGSVEAANRDRMGGRGSRVGGREARKAAEVETQLRRERAAAELARLEDRDPGGLR